MFLKRMELQGFKSFADKTIITFDSDVIGIVGPNGCGKSNINDAIRWVLGEQSAKSLRGSSMSDVIFNGANNRKAVNLAEVTLVFDNSKHILHLPYEEVEITRRLHRLHNEGEYFINRTPCRRKDVLDLVMDTGLGRDSLSIITQGNISAFAEAKPEERRALFEEAAGVAKYKKRKTESLNKLSRTKDNLARVDDILIELEKQITPLQKQAEKAKQFQEKKTQLESLEVSVLVDEIDTLTNKLKAIEQKLFDEDTLKVMNQGTLRKEEEQIESLRQNIKQLDERIYTLQQDYTQLSHDAHILEKQRIEIEEKRKYTMSIQDVKERWKELHIMMQEAKYEYEDRQQRVASLEKQLKSCKTKLYDITQQHQTVSKEQALQQTKLQKLYNRRDVVNNAIKQPFLHQHALQAVLDAKLDGVYGAVSSLLQAQEGYEVAISHTLSSAVYHIVTTDEKSARHAIAYLKKNQSGRATFLPLTVLKQRYVRKEHLQILESCSGYLGIATSFVHCDENFEKVKEVLCGNVLIVNNLENANTIARMLNYQYKIVTVDGDVVNRGGSMSGGISKSMQTPFTLKNDLHSLDEQITGIESLVEEGKTKVLQLQHQQQQIQSTIVQNQIALAKLEPILQVKQAKYERLRAEYEELAPLQEEALQEPITDTIVRLSDMQKQLDDVNLSLKSCREQRYQTAEELEQKESLLRDLRKDIAQIQEQIHTLTIQQTKYETKLDHALDRLRITYEMTYSFAKNKKIDVDMAIARREVIRLRQEISALGNVNLDALEEVEKVRERYTFLNEQKEELLYAKDQILQAISEMDGQMETQFLEMFQKINDELNEVFRSLFGGGKANLFLVNPNDILQSGIDIDVQPPGKTVQNIRLFSGGEKSLIAICVLFSILLARTVPLCIFDEVEAALDQANVERFAKYLGRFRSKSQFIIVTHRPGTMAQCDALYGVTMQQSGVSKLLKVQLQDALQYIENEEVKSK